MTNLKNIVYEKGDFWVLNVGAKGYEIYKNGITCATRCGIIGFQGQKGLDRCIQEIEKRVA